MRRRAGGSPVNGRTQAATRAGWRARHAASPADRSSRAADGRSSHGRAHRAPRRDASASSSSHGEVQDGVEVRRQRRDACGPRSTGTRTERETLIALTCAQIAVICCPTPQHLQGQPAQSTGRAIDQHALAGRVGRRRAGRAHREPHRRERVGQHGQCRRSRPSGRPQLLLRHDDVRGVRAAALPVPTRPKTRCPGASATPPCRLPRRVPATSLPSTSGKLAAPLRPSRRRPYPAARFTSIGLTASPGRARAPGPPSVGNRALAPPVAVAMRVPDRSVHVASHSPISRS